MKTKILHCLSLLSIASAVFAADPAKLAEREVKIEKASLCVDAGLLAPQVEQIGKEFAAAPDDPGLIYFGALGRYAEGSLARARNNPEKAAADFEEAGRQLEKIKDGPWHVEAVAFRGYLLNQLIGIKGAASGMSLGPKSSELLEKALRKAPQNPRVMFFRAVSLVTTPEMFGGDLAGGIHLLEEADVAFEKQAKDALVHWGRAESLAWLGIARKKNGDLAGARKAWERALAVEPEFGWVKYVLLPSLEKPAADKGQ